MQKVCAMPNDAKNAFQPIIVVVDSADAILNILEVFVEIYFHSYLSFINMHISNNFSFCISC